MDDATRKAWESGPYGKCLALAREDREQKRAGRLHWSAANFIDDDTPDANRVRPTEARAVQLAFWSCDDAHAVMRTVREMGRDAALPDYQPTFYSVWQQTVAAGKEAAMERQRVRFRQIVMRAVPLFDMAGIETKEESA